MAASWRLAFHDQGNGYLAHLSTYLPGAWRTVDFLYSLLEDEKTNYGAAYPVTGPEPELSRTAIAAMPLTLDLLAAPTREAASAARCCFFRRSCRADVALLRTPNPFAARRTHEEQAVRGLDLGIERRCFQPPFSTAGTSRNSRWIWFFGANVHRRCRRDLPFTSRP
jgi:hypothetical protein